MTRERKDELYDEFFEWICEHIRDPEDLFITLHEHFGMSREELHEHCIESLDEFFPKVDAATRLKEKLRGCFEQYRETWLQKRPDVLIEEAEEIASIQRVYLELPEDLTEEDAEYLLRFKNPLEVVADKWQSMNGYGSIVDDDMRTILWELRDRRDAEYDYELEPEYYETPDSAEPQMNHEMTM